MRSDQQNLDFCRLQADFLAGDTDSFLLHDPKLSNYFREPSNRYHIDHWFEAFSPNIQLDFLA
jgi:hypothetical protein